MVTKLNYLLLCVGVILTISCKKSPSDPIPDNTDVVTQCDPKVDFNYYKTYSIANIVLKITDKDTTPVTSQQASTILSQIDSNMKARGFVPVTDPIKPDLGILGVYYQNTDIYPYPYDYWGYYYYNWYYPYSPKYYSTYTTGMFTIDVVDFKNPDDEYHKLWIRWNSCIRDLLTGSKTNSEVATSIDQAFSQTPQFRTTTK